MKLIYFSSAVKRTLTGINRLCQGSMNIRQQGERHYNPAAWDEEFEYWSFTLLELAKKEGENVG